MNGHAAGHRLQARLTMEELRAHSRLATLSSMAAGAGVLRAQSLLRIQGEDYLHKQ